MYIIFLKISKRKKYNIKIVFFLISDIWGYYILYTTKKTIVYIFFDDNDTIVWYNNKNEDIFIWHGKTKENVIYIKKEYQNVNIMFLIILGTDF